MRQPSAPSLLPPPAPPAAAWSARWLARLARVTTSGQFIPEIDGLRFVAIMSVFCFHVAGRVAKVDGAAFTPEEHDWLYQIASCGGNGVLLFFVVSGFVLGLPFAQHCLAGARPVELRRYLLRRVTRLEPPYILNLLVVYLVTWAVLRLPVGESLPHLGASLVYLHNQIYDRGNPWNPVVWSLEVEVQFYLLAPLLAWVYRVPGAWGRRGAMAAVALIGCALTFWHPHDPPPASFPYYAAYFMMGFLLADLYITRWQACPARPAQALVWDALALAAAVAAVADCWTQWWQPVVLPMLFAVACAGVFRGRWARALLTYPWLAVTGGMCYTIYLYHKVFLHVFYHGTRHVVLTQRLWVNLLVQFALLAALILPLCAGLFLLSEKPFMYRDWPSRAWAFVRGRRGSVKAG